ncbi:MAG: (NiFe) hydrogenase maturation protein HypF [Pedosphaera sp.]|nr:(NiFe) hydrogenase maturation protein HypF [Pedosphaera sp.]
MNRERASITVRGAVQGVGFRPFVYRLAMDLGLDGWVLNSPQGVRIELEGEKAILDQFLLRLEKEKPRLAAIHSLECSFLTPIGLRGFEIHRSKKSGAKAAVILPDIATCADCLREIFDPLNRRHIYPFTNCTHCGPRYSIIEALPYDRANTSMKQFTMCPECAAEYRDPRDRRFHAQPNACPKCGPHLELWDASGKVLAQRHEALLNAAETVRAGKILALKALGGFQLIVDARSEEAVVRLRQRKRREEKPFALMHPSLQSILNDCEVSDLEARMLQSPEAPIVLLQRKTPLLPSFDVRCSMFDVQCFLDNSEKTQAAAPANPQSAIRNPQFLPAPSIAPRNPTLGVMLPSTPLHHLLLRELNFPIVATSANLAGEPICTDEHDALERLRSIADCFLVHNRPIIRHVDDSVARIVLGREMILRRARGYAPLPIQINSRLSTIGHQPIFNSQPVLAVGGNLKNTVALGVGRQVFLSQHIGDLETKEAYVAFRNAATDLPRLYDAAPARIACDLHPDYLSTQFARRSETPVQAVQHHYAHVLSCMAENALDAPALGVAWDGTGYGNDGTIWGGEFLRITGTSFERAAHFRQFKLPGGDACGKQLRRSALGLLFEIFGPGMFDRHDLIPLQHFSAAELTALRQMLKQDVNVPLTSSAGRLFDAVASVMGLRQRASFEGQAAMELEFIIQPGIEESYDFGDWTGTPVVIDWEPLVLAILAELQNGQSVGIVAARFHNTLADIIVEIARHGGLQDVVLTGGCFQNKYLIERTVTRLRTQGFNAFWHQRVPPNDGGLALGQIMAAYAAIQTKEQYVPGNSRQSN